MFIYGCERRLVCAIIMVRFVTALYNGVVITLDLEMSLISYVFERR